jgi:hypothetical protein
VRTNALYVTTDTLTPNGKVVRIQLDRSWDGSWDGGSAGWHSGDEPSGDTTDDNSD